jgi:hypothetical protein
LKMDFSNAEIDVVDVCLQRHEHGGLRNRRLTKKKHDSFVDRKWLIPVESRRIPRR